jgi:single-strand DNA-binding protein
MASYNKVILLGNLTRDPQLSYTPNQTAVVDFGLATNRRWKGQDGTQRDDTCFVDCRMFGRRAEVINNYLKKGQPIFLEGRLSFSSWEAQDGSKRSKLRVTVENFEFVGGGGSGGQSGGKSSGPSRNQSYQGGAPESPEFEPGMPDDDIPF